MVASVIAVICPSRSRPIALARMLDSMRRTSTNTTAIVYIDDDDPHAGEYDKLDRDRLELVTGSRIGRVPAANLLVEKFDHPHYLMMPDDATFDRIGWDIEIEAAMSEFTDNIGLVSLAHSSGSHTNFPCVTREWIKALGYYEYPGCRHFCVDTIMQVLAEALDRIRTVHPLVVTHHAEMQPNVSELGQHDIGAFLSYMAFEFGRDLQKLRSAMR